MMNNIDIDAVANDCEQGSNDKRPPGLIPERCVFTFGAMT
jgi:hypothetical protein